MKLIPLTLCIIIASASLLAVGCSKENEQASAAAAQQMPPSMVNVIPVQFQAVPLVETFSGRTKAFQTADVRPQTTGIVEAVTFQEGTMVQKGQELYRINIDNYQTTRAGNAAAVQQALANIDTAKASYNSALANLASQKALQEQASVDVQRVQPLLAIQAISQQQVDQAITKFKTAQAAVASAQAAVEQAQANVRSVEAAAATAQANLDSSTIELNRTVVRAPISGQTSRSEVTTGALVSANQATPMVTISQINPIYVDISRSSADLLKLKQKQASGELQPGSPIVELVLEDGTTYPVAGQLLLEEASVDESTGSVTLRAIFKNDNTMLLPGMFVTAKLVEGVMNNAVLLPQSAMMRTPKGETQVYVVDAEDKIQIRKVQVDGTFEGNWIVTSGLQANERVVVNGGAKVKPEQKVVAKPAPSLQSNSLAAPQGAPVANRPVLSGQGPVAPQVAQQNAQPRSNAPQPPAAPAPQTKD